ncbi:MAG: DUF192 domain-containing protein [Haloarculaceae archaeon]
MRVVHDPDGRARPLATTVDVADSFVSQTVGLMGQSSLPEAYALVFRFGTDGPDGFERAVAKLPGAGWPPRRFIHMLFVGVALDVLWLRDGEVVAVETLRPWTGYGVARADTIVELPAGAAADVAVGDRVAIEDDPDDETEAPAAAADG